MQLIERPVWIDDINLYALHRKLLDHLTPREIFKQWFDENLEGRAVVDPKEIKTVYGGFNEGYFLDPSQNKCHADYFKAKIFGIEIHQQETCADVLKDVIDNGSLKLNMLASKKLHARAKAAIERESCNKLK